MNPPGGIPMGPGPGGSMPIIPGAMPSGPAGGPNPGFMTPPARRSPFHISITVELCNHQRGPGGGRRRGLPPQNRVREQCNRSATRGAAGAVGGGPALSSGPGCQGAVAAAARGRGRLLAWEGSAAPRCRRWARPEQQPLASHRGYSSIDFNRSKGSSE